MKETYISVYIIYILKNQKYPLAKYTLHKHMQTEDRSPLTGFQMTVLDEFHYMRYLRRVECVRTAE